MKQIAWIILGWFDLLATAQAEVGLIRELLDLCGELRPEHEAQAWKLGIEQTIEQRIAYFNTGSSTY